VALTISTGGADAISSLGLDTVLSGRLARPTQTEGELWSRRVTLALTVALVLQAAFLVVWAAAARLFRHGTPAPPRPAPIQQVTPPGTADGR
jgi:hypothetical protein